MQNPKRFAWMLLLAINYLGLCAFSKDNTYRINQLTVVQNSKIIGAIVDANNEPIKGASVILSPIGLSTTSDSEGRFNFDVPQGVYTLEVRYLSYKTHKQSGIKVGAKSIDLHIKLEADESKDIEEVVVVGFGETKKESLVGSINKVDTDVLTERPLVDAGSLLQGASPGLNIVRPSGKMGADTRINIRGFTSINGGSPLIIIDGFEGDINNLNVNDIASISVLKDAGASAIYGARGAYGVVLITTKNAQQGKMVVDFSYANVQSTPTVNTDFLTDPYKMITLIDSAHKLTTGATFSQYTAEDYAALKEVSENPSLARVVIANRNGKDQYVHYGYTDWWDYYNREWAPSNLYNASVSGGNDRIKSYFSYQHYNSLGILKVQDDKYKRNSFRGKFEIKVNDWLKFTNNAQFYSSNDLIHRGADDGSWDGDADIAGWGSTLAPSFYIPTNPDGTAFYKTGLNSYAISGGRYAAALYGKAIRQTDDTEYANFITANLNPFKNFNVTASYSFRQSQFERFERTTKIPYSLYPGVIDYVGTDDLAEFRTTEKYNAVNVFADYTRSFQKHNLKGLLGFNQESYTSKNISAEKQDNISDDLNSLNLASGAAITSGGGGEWALRGIFYRLAYDYDSKYLLELNGRYDGSSRFPKDSRWGFFPSVSAGWVLSKEGFMQPVQDWVSFLKFRGSYGTLGNQNIGNYVYQSTLSKSLNAGYALGGKQLEYMTAPALTPLAITWEEVTTTNLGMDLNLFKDKVTFNADIFRRDTKGMLTQSATRPSVLGASSPLTNAADLRTDGYELSLGYKNQFLLAEKPFRFAVTANLSNTTTKITKFDNPLRSLNNYYEGMNIGEIWGYHIEGFFQTDEEVKAHANQQQVAARQISTGGLKAGDVKYADVNGDNIISVGANTVDNPGDRSIIGNSAPQYLHGLKMDASWNGIDFSVFFTGVGKQEWYPHANSRVFWGNYSQSYTSFIRKDMLDDMWSPENPDAYFPRLWGFIAFNDNATLATVNDKYLQDISYLKLRNLTVGYTIPDKMVKRMHLNKLRVFFSGENLFTWSKLTDYIDPEAASNTVNFNQVTSSAYRSNSITVPYNSSYSFGVSLQF